MRRLSPEDVARASVDPSFGRKLLDAIETGVWPARRGRRRVSATFGVGTARGRPPDLPQPEYSTVGTDRTRTTFFEAPPPVGTTARALRAMDRVNNRREQ
jgi:hypothetical protein